MENAEKEGWGKGWTNKGSEEEERWTHITKILQNSPRDGLSQNQKTFTWRPIGTLSPAARSLKNQRCPVQDSDIQKFATHVQFSRQAHFLRRNSTSSPNHHSMMIRT